MLAASEKLRRFKKSLSNLTCSLIHLALPLGSVASVPSDLVVEPLLPVLTVRVHVEEEDLCGVVEHVSDVVDLGCVLHGHQMSAQIAVVEGHQERDGYSPKTSGQKP